MNPNPPPVDPVAIARDAAARAADATADAYRALAQVTRLVAHPQGEPMPWDPIDPDKEQAAADVEKRLLGSMRLEAPAPVPAPAPVVVTEPETTTAASQEPTPPPAVEDAPEPEAPPADGPAPTTPLTAEQQAQARGWVGSMAAPQRKAFTAAFRHAFSVDPAEKSVAPLIVQWQHYAFVDRFVIEAAGGVAP